MRGDEWAAWLGGTWDLARRIDDRAAGRVGRLVGTARFEGAKTGGEAMGAGDLVCTETGVLDWGAAAYPARARTLWRVGEAGVTVRFADGRAFHGWTWDRPTAVHLCGADTYRVVYDFGAADWTSVWTVSGPAKDYTMTSRYSRPA